MSVNALVLERFVVVKNLFPEIGQTSIAPKLSNIEFTVVYNGNTQSKRFNGTYRETIRWLQEVTGNLIFVRGDFPLYGEFREWLQQGKKVTTIRYRKGGVEIPISIRLPLFATKDFFITRMSDEPITVEVKGMKYAKFGELTEEDAKRDGFQDLRELREQLIKIYPSLVDDDWVTVYSINPVKLPMLALSQ